MIAYELSLVNKYIWNTFLNEATNRISDTILSKAIGIYFLFELNIYKNSYYKRNSFIKFDFTGQDSYNKVEQMFVD